LLAALSQVGDLDSVAHAAHDGSHRNLNDYILAVATVSLALAAVLADLCLDFLFVSKTHKSIQARISLEDHVAALAAVTTVWAALVDILFMTKTDGPIAALACCHNYYCMIYEHIFIIP
jgi:hypothetical protein